MALSPSGDRLARVGSRGVLIFDAHTGALLTELPAQDEAVFQLVFRTDDQLLTGGQFGELREWDLKAGRSISLPAHHGSAIRSLAVWEDYTVSGDTKGNAFLWRDGVVLAALGAQEETGDGVTISSEIERSWVGPHGVLLPNGPRSVALFGLDGRFIRRLEIRRVQDVASTPSGWSIVGRVAQKQSVGHPGIEMRISHFDPRGEPIGQTLVVVGDPTVWDLSPDGRSLAGWDYGSGLRVWDLDPVRPRFLRSLLPANHHPSRLIFSEDGSQLALESQDILTTVDAQTGAPAVDTERPTAHAISAAQLGSDGWVLMSDDQRIWLWQPAEARLDSIALTANHLDRAGDTLIGLGDTLWALHLPTREILWELSGKLGYTMANASSASADGSVVVYGGYDAELVVVNGQTGERVRTLAIPSEAWDVQLSSDGERVAASYGDHIGVWEVDSGALVHTLDRQGDDLLGWAGDTLAVASDDRIFTVNTQTWQVTDRGEGSWLGGCFSTDGRWLAWRGEQGPTQLLDLQEHKRYRIPLGSARTTAIDPRGDTLLVASEDQTVALFPLAALQLAPESSTAPAIQEHPHQIEPVDIDLQPPAPPTARSADGRVVATLDTEVEVSIAGKPALSFRPTSGYTDHIALSPDGSVLATGSSDGLVRLWSLPDGASLGAIRARGPVTRIAFADDQRLVFLAYREGGSPVIGAALVDTTPLWIHDDLPYGRSNAFALFDGKIAVFYPTKVEFIDLDTGEVIARMSSNGDWVREARWTGEGLISWDGEHSYAWELSWLP